MRLLLFLLLVGMRLGRRFRIDTVNRRHDRSGVRVRSIGNQLGSARDIAHLGKFELGFGEAWEARSAPSREIGRSGRAT